MFRVRAALAFGAALALVISLGAQPGGRQKGENPWTGGPGGRFTPVPSPLAVTLLREIDAAGVAAELKLSEAQVKTLVARRQSEWDEQYTTAPTKFAEGTTARTEATDALLKKTLSADQYKRAVQLAAQQVLGNDRYYLGRGGRGGTTTAPQVARATLTRYPELVAAFKLTDVQMKELTAAPDPRDGPGRAFVTLTAEQATAAKEFVGEAYTKEWVSRYDERLSTPRGRTPQNLYLTDSRDVRAELKLTEAQAKALAAMREKWTKLRNDARTTLSPKDTDAAEAILTAETEKAFAAFDPAQTKRLKQIAFQDRWQWRGTDILANIENLISDEEFAKELAITEAQVKAAEAVREGYLKDAAAAFEAGLPFAETEKKVNALIEARPKKVAAVLTADQTAKLKELTGEPFTRSTVPDAQRGVSLEVQRKATFGKYTTIEFALLAGNTGIQTELKLTAEQVQKASAVNTELRGKFPTPPDEEGYLKAYADESKFVEAELGKLLTAEQAKRFRELMIQSRQPQGATGKTGKGDRGSRSINSPVTYPGVAEAIKLTDEQRTKLLTGVVPEEVLTADQKDAIAKMLGTPYTGSFSPFGTTPGGWRPAGGRAGVPSSAVAMYRSVTFGNYTNELDELAGNKSVQDELKLKAEQIKKATELRDEIAKIPLPTLNPTTFADATKAYTERSKSVGEAVAKILDKVQVERFRQIMMQFRERVTAGNNDPRFGIRTPVASAVSYPGVAAEVKLTDDQKSKLITGAITAAEPASVLTADQKTAIAKLLGEPFKGTATNAGPTGSTNPLLTARNVTFGKYSTELLQLAGNADIQKELKLTAEQIKQATTLRDEIAAKYRPSGSPLTDPDGYTKTIAERSDAIGAAVAKLLTAEQAKRFRELMLQARQPQGAPGSGRPVINSPVSYPGVAEAVKFTDEQKTKLLAGTLPDEVLTADQKTAIDKMLGEPFKGSLAVPSSFVDPRGPGLATATAVRSVLVGTPSPEEALKLTAEQKKSLATVRELYKEYLAKLNEGRVFPGGGGPRGGPAGPSPLQPVTTAIAEFQKLLTPAQTKRLDQLVVQYNAATQGLSTILASRTTGLDLTAEQSTKFTAVEAEATKFQELLLRATTAGRGDWGGTSGVVDPQQAERLRDQADDRLLAVLTDAQKAKWKELTGEPWTGLTKTIRPNRGGGGPGMRGGPPGGGGFSGPGAPGGAP